MKHRLLCLLLTPIAWLHVELFDGAVWRMRWEDRRYTAIKIFKFLIKL